MFCAELINKIFYKASISRMILKLVEQKKLDKEAKKLKASKQLQKS